jgi:surface protein
MSFMFASTDTFDRILPQWNTANDTDMSGICLGERSFNQVLPAWDTGRVTCMSCMFYDATSFNQSVPAWDTGRVTNMSFLFAGAIRCNEPLPLFVGHRERHKYSQHFCWYQRFRSTSVGLEYLNHPLNYVRSTSAGLEYINPRLLCVCVCPSFGGCIQPVLTKFCRHQHVPPVSLFAREVLTMLCRRHGTEHRKHTRWDGSLTRQPTRWNAGSPWPS